MIIWSFLWLGLGIWGLISGNDTVFIVGLVSSTVNTVGSQICTEIRKVNRD